MQQTESAALQQIQERLYCLEAIIDHISEGVLLTDRECRITVFNPAKEEMELMRAEDVMGKLSWDAYSHSSEEISEHKRVFDTRAPILNVYRPHAYVDDIPVYISYSTYPIIREGDVLGVFTISRNETMIKELLYETVELKRQLRKANAEPVKKTRLAKGTHFYFTDILGSSPEMAKVIRDSQSISTMETPILIIGETGTGKEVLAQSIHNLGRPDKKFVAVNCAAIPENLVETILFGCKKGAYTGAVDSVGLFEAAADGTLFLDEINSMSVNLQAKLLRTLQERAVRPVGGLQEIPIKCRLIFASNEQPEVLLKEKRLRQDLFYRMSGFRLFIPPLRDRRADIVELAQHFIQRSNREFNKNIRGMSPDLSAWLWEQEWPGNIRELEHFIQNMILHASETARELVIQDIPEYLLSPEGSSGAPGAGRPESADYLDTTDLNGTLKRVQRDILLHNLRKYGFNVTRTAEQLGIVRQNLLKRMTRLGIRREDG